MANRSRSVVTSWKVQSLSTKVLRLWLGLTWIYAGWDKATDSSFLTPGTVNYIGNQIRGFAEISPIKPLLIRGLEHAPLIGWLVLIIEFVIGISTLLFIMPRFAAFLGFATSIGFWLTVTFHVKPYFLGSDTAYATMWLAYLLLLNSGKKGRTRKLNMERRGFLRLGSVFGITGGLIGLGQLFSKKEAIAATGKKIIKVESLQIGGNFKFKNSHGEPAMLFRTKAGVFAYSLICTHQGCTVGYSGKQLLCPCHGATFDPYKGGKATGKPATKPLNSVKVKIIGNYVVEA